MEIIETSADGKYRAGLAIHGDAENPRRDYEHIVHVITPKGQRYIDVDPTGGPLQDGWNRVTGREDAVEVFARWARIFHGAVVVEDRPNDGAWALWYMTPAQIAEIGNTPEEAIRIEIDEYRSWAEGDVWGYVVEKYITWIAQEGDIEAGEDIPVSHSTWEEVESCWGLIGRDYAEEEARRSLRDCAKEAAA